MFEDYMDRVECVFALDHVKEVRDAISPPFIRVDPSGDIAISDPVSDEDDRARHVEAMLSRLIKKINSLERELKTMKNGNLQDED